MPAEIKIEVMRTQLRKKTQALKSCALSLVDFVLWDVAAAGCYDICFLLLPFLAAYFSNLPKIILPADV